jgi:hypothetical protein
LAKDHTNRSTEYNRESKYGCTQIEPANLWQRNKGDSMENDCLSTKNAETIVYQQSNKWTSLWPYIFHKINSK